MTTAILSAKGQVTLPKQIRDLLGVHKGDKVDFHAMPNGEVRVTPVNLSVDDVFGLVEEEVNKSCSDEEIREGIKREVRGKWKR